jgi:hypothetical protein
MLAVAVPLLNCKLKSWSKTSGQSLDAELAHGQPLDHRHRQTDQTILQIY